MVVTDKENASFKKYIKSCELEKDAIFWSILCEKGHGTVQVFCHVVCAERWV